MELSESNCAVEMGILERELRWGLMKMERIILGGGIYGLYAAIRSAEKGYGVLVMDMEEGPFRRGSYINQARLHNGYHYPRSMATAYKSSQYFQRFMEDFGTECNNTDFQQVYAIARDYSWTNSRQFQRFCRNLHIRCEKMDKSLFFNPVTVEDAFLTEECSFDAGRISDKMYREAKEKGVEFQWGVRIESMEKGLSEWRIHLQDGREYRAPFVLNATYAGVNQIHRLAGYEFLPIKYELCEVILCEVSEAIQKVGVTVMDGPFFSVMPFGKTGLHSITTVSRTPHMTSYDALPSFPCQAENWNCMPECTENCNTCAFHPKTAFTEMRQIARRYLREDIEIRYIKSLFTLKPILKTSEIDDSRPTIIRKYSEQPDFYTVFSGKINTMYDLDSIL